MKTSSASLEIRNAYDELARMAVWLREAGQTHGLPKPTIDDLDFCLGEIVTNIINYGYADGAKHRIFLTLEFGKDDVVLQVEDDGKPFDASKKSSYIPPQSLEEAHTGGYGVFLVQQFMDELSYSRVDGKNILRMKALLNKKAAR
jgi:anti-sigma regulatory factor (Ser/Thr protein kinase)